MPDIAEYTTITVIGSQVIRREGGRIAMTLHTREQGVLAFDLNKAGLAALGVQVLNAAELLNAPGSTVSIKRNDRKGRASPVPSRHRHAGSASTARRLGL